MDKHFLRISRDLKEILQWCESRITGELLYLSADIRDAGFKLTPVDANIFPAGFHILSERSQRVAANMIQESYTGKTILLIAENHTRNIHYLNNVRTLKKLLEDANNIVLLGNPANQKMEDLNTERFHINNGEVVTESGTIPDLIILNNDMISLDISMFSGLSQPCIPSPLLGWCNRRKSQYFPHYLGVVEEFSETFDFDPWLFSAYFKSCSDINFDSRSSTERLVDVVEELLQGIRKKHEQYRISSKPFVFIKANRGSYGMGILAVNNAKDILSMNKRDRNKLRVTKGGAVVTDVIVQEGVETAEQYCGYPAETLLYSVLGKKIEFLIRYNTKHDTRQNLNSPGMCFANYAPAHNINPQMQVVSDLTIIAAEREAQSVEKKKITRPTWQSDLLPETRQDFHRHHT